MGFHSVFARMKSLPAGLEAAWCPYRECYTRPLLRVSRKKGYCTYKLLRRNLEWHRGHQSRYLQLVASVYGSWESLIQLVLVVTYNDVYHWMTDECRWLCDSISILSDCQGSWKMSMWMSAKNIWYSVCPLVFASIILEIYEETFWKEKKVRKVVVYEAFNIQIEKLCLKLTSIQW